MGFRRGVSQISPFRINEFRERMMQAMGWTSRQILLDYQNGRREPVRSQAAAIEKVFAEFGVTKNIWGDEPESKADKA